MAAEQSGVGIKARSPLRRLAVWGPGLLVMLADTDAGNVVAAAQAGAQFGFLLAPLVFALIPALYLVQEQAARLGLFTGRGFGESIRESFGRFWALAALAALALTTFGTLVTEFTGVAGVGEIYGLSRGVTLPAACFFLLAVAASGSYRRVEAIALAIGLFEGAFLIVAWKARPDVLTVARDIFHAPLGDRSFLFLAAAIVGSVFNPWMVFYQQSATARKNMHPDDFAAARWDTGFGAVLTQTLTGAVLIAAAAALYRGDGVKTLASIGEVAEALAGVLGRETGQAIFSLGVLGASLAAAVVASLALAWGVGEILGPHRARHEGLFDSRWFFGLYAASIFGAAAIVGASGDLVWLNIAAQASNALLFPLVIGLLIALATRMTPPAPRLQGLRLWITVTIAVTVALIGLTGLIAALTG